VTFVRTGVATVGTAVSARVTGDRRYLYRLWPASDT